MPNTVLSGSNPSSPQTLPDGDWKAILLDFLKRIFAFIPHLLVWMQAGIGATTDRGRNIQENLRKLVAIFIDAFIVLLIAQVLKHRTDLSGFFWRNLSPLTIVAGLLVFVGLLILYGWTFWHKGKKCFRRYVSFVLLLILVIAIFATIYFIFQHDVPIGPATPDHIEDAERLFETIQTPSEDRQWDKMSSGHCGDRVQWILYMNGVLRIFRMDEADDSAEYRMYNFTSEGTVQDPSKNENLSWWKNYRDKIKAVEIGDKVSNIGAYAFAGCHNLLLVSVSSDLREIGAGAFADCGSLLDIRFFGGTNKDVSTRSTTFLKGILTWMWGKDAFAPSGAVVLSESIEVLGERAFSKCSSLTSVIIPESIERIPSYLFVDCKNLERVVLHKTVTRIGEGAFSGCFALKEVWNERKSKNCFALPRMISEIGKSAFYHCDSMTKLSLPSELRVIQESAFSCCGSLSEVKIPESVMTIEKRAFFDCKSLEKVWIQKSEDGVPNIEDDAFAYDHPQRGRPGEVSVRGDIMLLVPGDEQEEFVAALQNVEGIRIVAQ